MALPYGIKILDIIAFLSEWGSFKSQLRIKVVEQTYSYFIFSDTYIQFQSKDQNAEYENMRVCYGNIINEQHSLGKIVLG